MATDFLHRVFKQFSCWEQVDGVYQGEDARSSAVVTSLHGLHKQSADTGEPSRRGWTDPRDGQENMAPRPFRFGYPAYSVVAGHKGPTLTAENLPKVLPPGGAQPCLTFTGFGLAAWQGSYTRVDLRCWIERQDGPLHLAVDKARVVTPDGLTAGLQPVEWDVVQYRKTPVQAGAMQAVTESIEGALLQLRQFLENDGARVHLDAGLGSFKRLCDKHGDTAVLDTLAARCRALIRAPRPARLDPRLAGRATALSF